jgi:peptidoglycan/LPS O-acetylase OafA/YrhL
MWKKSKKVYTPTHTESEKRGRAKRERVNKSHTLTCSHTHTCFHTHTHTQVDTFFFLSAFLAVYFMLEEIERSSSRSFLLKTPLIYVLRFLRLTPTYFFVLLMYWYVYVCVSVCVYGCFFFLVINVLVRVSECV